MSAESTETVEPVESIQPPKTIKIKPQSNKKKKDLDIYSSAIITKDVYISIVNVGNSIIEVALFEFPVKNKE